MIPLTRHGLREILIAGLACGAAAALFLRIAESDWPPAAWFASIPALLFLFVLYFFRDPRRRIPDDPAAFVAPADGVVTAIDEVEGPSFLGERALRISIFLSVLDVHLNRAPYTGRVVYLHHTPGRFVNAMRADSAELNERNDLGVETGDPRVPRYLVRQIAGLIARRIVCPVRVGQHLARGERFGMIKFGSRTDLYLPLRAGFRPSVRVGDTVRGGATILGRLGAVEAEAGVEGMA